MYINLLSPIEIGKLQLENRIVLAPMGIGTWNTYDETVEDDYITFLENRARGTGLIITTGCRVSSKYGKLRFFGCYSDNQIKGLSKLTKAVHNKGSKIFLQILALGGFDTEEPYVPSIDVPEYSTEWKFKAKPKELKTYEIKEIRDDFAQAARRAKEANFDGVELWASEDGLISTFMTPYFNHRKDEYGGSFYNMMRFPVEIIKEIKKICGEDFPIGFKFNAFYDLPDGIDFNLGVKIAKKVLSAGAAYVHTFTYAKSDKPMSLFKYPPLPNLYQKRNSTIDVSKNLKNNIPDKVIIAASGILKPDEADEIISKEYADMVAIGRAFIADGEWSFKTIKSQYIRPCIRCHVCHHEVATLGNLVVCSVNPDVLGVEKVDKIIGKPKDIKIIGAGPAGIMAAITAAKRGHKITLYEKNNDIGGMLVPGSRPDFKHEFQDFLSYLREEINNANIRLIKNFEVTTDYIYENKPDILVLAIGGVPIIPDIKGIQNARRITAEDALIKGNQFNGESIIIVGGGDVGCETALHLCKKDNKVTIIEKLDKLMEDDEIKYNTVVLEKMLKDAGVKILTSANIIEVKEDNLTVTIDGNKVELPFNLIGDIVKCCG